MKKISYWAKHHVWQSRVLIVSMWLVINIIGIFAGKSLTEINITVPEYFWSVCIVSAIFLIACYPQRIGRFAGTYSKLYTRRKVIDFFLGLVTFFMIIYISNYRQTLFSNTQYTQASAIIPAHRDSSISNHPLIKNFILKIKSADVSHMSSREKMKLIKQQLRKVNADKEISKSTKTLLIILTVLLAIVLIMGIAALSCTIACSGSEALAILVGIGGTFLVAFLAVRLIKQISRRAATDKSENVVPK